MSTWTTLVLVIHVIIAIALVATILLQRSEGGGLGIGGAGGGLMSARGAANALTRMTGFLAIAFLSTSIILAVMAGYSRSQTSKVQELLQRDPAELSVPDAGVPALAVPDAGVALPADPATVDGLEGLPALPGIDGPAATDTPTTEPNKSGN